MKITQVLALFVCIILIAVSGITDAGEKKLVNVKVPLPDDIKIAAPAEDIPKDIAAFSGVWEGKDIGKGIGSVLVVEEINSKEAKVIYCREAWKDERGDTSDAWCYRFKAIVTPEKRQIEFGQAQKQPSTFIMGNNLNQIKGTVKKATDTDKLIMTKIK